MQPLKQTLHFQKLILGVPLCFVIFAGIEIGKRSYWFGFVFIEKIRRYGSEFDDLFLCYRYEDSENNYQKYLELKSGDSNAEKELSQLHQAKNALDTASTLYESKDIAKALEFVDKVVLVFSPACSKVLFLMAICNISYYSLIMQFLFAYIVFHLQAKLLKVKLLMVSKDYSAAISETGYILKEDENNLEALLLRGRAYYYLADHDIAQRFGLTST